MKIPFTSLHIFVVNSNHISNNRYHGNVEAKHTPLSVLFMIHANNGSSINECYKGGKVDEERLGVLLKQRKELELQIIRKAKGSN